MDEFIGIIKIFAGNFAPQGYMFCNGQLLPISQYAALYSVLGTTYGGDGVTNFALPNLQGRVAIHAGQSQGGSNHTLGQQAGSENVTLTTNQMPSHSHSVRCSNMPGTQASPENAVWAEGPNPGGRGSASPSQYATTSNAAMSAGALLPVGGNQPFSVLPPYLTLNFIICVQGIYPSRP